MSLNEHHGCQPTRPDGDSKRRRAVMAVLAHAKADEIAGCLQSFASSVCISDLRPPEIGLAMLRGRIGGDGAPFNLGETTVTRAAVQLDSGERGFGYVLGRDPRKARLAAVCDALWQTRLYRDEIEQHVVLPLHNAQEERRSLKRAQAATTRVDFFTLVRGEDER